MSTQASQALGLRREWVVELGAQSMIKHSLCDVGLKSAQDFVAEPVSKEDQYNGRKGPGALCDRNNKAVTNSLTARCY